MLKSLTKEIKGLCEFCDHPAKFKVHGAIDAGLDDEGNFQSMYGDMKLCREHNQERREGEGLFEPQYE